LILAFSSGIGSAAEIRVSSGQSIQAAVNSANSGDTIIVDPGTYVENIAITKTSNLVLMSASQNPDDTIIVSNDTTKDVISATSRMNLVIKGFTISGAATDHSGIRLNSCRDCTIEKNKLLNDGMGVYLQSCINTIVRNNAATRTSDIGTGRGINIEKSVSTTLSSNSVSNQRFGIYLSGSLPNTISGNTISQNNDTGITLESSGNSVLESNNVSSNGKKGIYLKDSSKSSVKNNVVSSNAANGIDLEASSGSTVLNNKVSGNAKDTNIHGIFLNTCKDNSVQNNEMSNCQYGYAMRFSENNSLVNNNAHDNAIGFYVSYTSSRNTLSGNKASSNANGIRIEIGANNNIVDKNEANSNSAVGIALDNATNNKISNNDVSSNNRGISLLSLSTKNTISGNTVNSNRNDGIVLENTTENNITSNIANSNTRYGIFVTSSNNSYVVSNTAQNNVRGISLQGSVKDIISKNTLTDCTQSGLFLTTSSENNLSQNIVCNNGEGISIDSSPNNEISSNNVSSNGNGIYMCPRSTENKAYDNYFNNTNNANIRNNKSFWNTEKISGIKNIMKGPTLGGNFWGSPSLMGFSDTYLDNDSDGIIDTPFVSGNVTDNYPLIRMVVPVPSFDANPTKGFVPLTVQFTDHSQNADSISWDANGDGKTDNTNKSFTYVYTTPGTYTVTLLASNKNSTEPATVQILAQKYVILPVADFSASPTSGYAPLAVQFTDLSQNAASRNWNFGDGVTSTDQNPSHTYSTAGTYTVSLTATNENGTSPAKTAQITVTQQSSSSGSSSGGSSHHSSGGSSSGGGGGGGSPEPQSNVEIKEISQTQVSSGKLAKFDFARNATCVVYASFDAKKTAGKTTATAEQLKGKSTLVSVLDSGEVYKYFNLWIGSSGFATSKNIENPVVCFKVDKSWIKDKNIDQNSITLNRYSDKKWSQLPVKCLNEDQKYLYFTAQTPEFSYFAITGKAIAKQNVVETKPSTKNSDLKQNNTTASDTESKQKPEQKSDNGSLTSIPGFEAIYLIACILTALMYKRK